jgi:hypothetical protein
MIEADEVRHQIKSEWRSDAEDAEKAARIRTAREVTFTQLRLVEEKLARMETMRDELRERLARYDHWLVQHATAAVAEQAR